MAEVRRGPRWMRPYLASSSALFDVLNGTRGAFEGAWLGVLDGPRLGALDHRHYGADADYVDEEYNRGGLFRWEQRLVDAHLRPGARVAVIGAGGGREVLALRAQGFDADGYEPHPALARFGAELTAAQDGAPRVFVCDRVAWPAGASGLDAVLVGWGTYTVVGARSRRIRLLRDAARAAGGGPVVLSYLTMFDNRVRLRATVAVARRIRVLRGAEPPLLGDALEPEYVHYFSVEQVEQELAAAGLVAVGHGRTGAETPGYGWTVARGARPPAEEAP